MKAPINGSGEDSFDVAKYLQTDDYYNYSDLS